MRVFIFGDSIAQGYFDTQSGGWANQIATEYQRRIVADPSAEWVHVFNLGVSADTASGVAERMGLEIEARRLSAPTEECIVLAGGINDACLIQNRPAFEEYSFQDSYEQLIGKALQFCPRVVCVGLTAVEESLTDPWAYSSTGKQWKNNRINLFEDIIKQSSLRKEVAFVPLHDKFLRGLQESDLLTDGLHPNAAGHKLIASEVLAAIEALR